MPQKASRRLTEFRTLGYSASSLYGEVAYTFGAVAQLGERMTGSHEVRGSIPLGSTNKISNLGRPPRDALRRFVPGVCNLENQPAILGLKLHSPTLGGGQEWETSHGSLLNFPFEQFLRTC